jgi:hypothetical protein
VKPLDLGGLAARLSTAGLRVSADAQSDGEGASSVWLTVEGLADDGVSVRRRADRLGPVPLGPAPEGPLGLFGRDWRPAMPASVVLGDQRFDAEFVAEGPAAHVRARLDAPTRAAALALVTGSVRVARAGFSGGSLSVEVPTGGFTRAHPGLESAGRAALALARLLAAPLDVAARLRASLRDEPEPAVRLEGLRALAAHLPEGGARREALRQATRDPWPPIRLQAALGLEEEGHAVLVALADEDETPDECAAQAVRALGAAYPAARAAAAINRGLTRRARSQTVAACVEALVPHGAQVEPTLLAVLGKGDLECVRAAARALAAVGTAGAVMPLREAAARRGRGAARVEVEDAILRIQSRLSSAPGAVSLATDAAAGQVSLSGGETGRVTLSGEPPSRKR